jgi:signal transduction histidine kinase
MPSVEMALELQPDQWNKNSIFLDKIQKSLHIQKEIIDQVRSLDAIRSGKQDLILKPVDLAETIHMSYFIFKDKLKEKNIHFEFILEDRFFVMAEPVSLSHSVIDNLISNAIKFSYPEGTIYVEIKNQNEWICLSVKDTGIGIPDYILENLFKEDCKTTRNGTNGEKGTGFGMPLVKAYVEEFGGKISISTKNQKDFPLDHGTTISLFLKKA